MNPSIWSRHDGSVRLGWTDNWQISASADSQGNVTIIDDGSLLYSQELRRQLTRARRIRHVTLTNGAYQYVETDGTMIAFNTDGSLDYEQDTNGNRITAGYNASGGSPA